MNPTHPLALPTRTTERLLRGCMLMFWLMLGVGLLFMAPSPTDPLTPTERMLPIVAFLGFGAALWLNTRHFAPNTLERKRMALLGFQTVLGFTLHTDLLYLIAAQIPLSLPAQAALIWIISQTVLLFCWIFWLDAIGQPLMLMPIEGFPHIAVLLLTDIAVFAGHGFAFFMGYLAASESRGRREAERVNAELAATRDLLAQSSRAAERTFIARELHDTLGHHLVALKVNLELARHRAQGPAASTVADSFDLVCRLLNEVREVVGQVRAAPPIDLRTALQTMLGGISEFTAHLRFPDDIEIRDPLHSHILFRCVQEAVTNTLKHAGARNLWIEFEQDAASLRLAIRDDGHGSRSLADGNGLAGMRERLESAGGHLVIRTGAGAGFALSACLPVDARPRGDLGVAPVDEVKAK